MQSKFYGDLIKLLQQYHIPLIVTSELLNSYTTILFHRFICYLQHFLIISDLYGCRWGADKFICSPSVTV